MYIATYGDNYGIGETLSEAIDNLENALIASGWFYLQGEYSLEFAFMEGVNMKQYTDDLLIEINKIKE